MKTINLRWIYPHYRHDEFVEVSDEVWEVMRQAQREMNNYERRKVYHRAYYSLDAYSWAENYALGLPHDLPNFIADLHKLVMPVVGINPPQIDCFHRLTS